MINKISQHIIFTLVLLITYTCVEAQVFYGGITSGVAISRVDGNFKKGYHKISPIIGVFTRNSLSKNWGLSIGIEYKRKGTTEIEKDEYGYVQSYYSSSFDYIEIPALAKYKLDKIGIPGLFSHTFKNNFFINAGLSYSFLIKAVENFGHYWESLDPRRPMKRYDIPWHLGVEYYLTKHWIFEYRYSYTLFFLPIRDYPGKQTYYFNRGQYNNNMNFIIKFEF